MPRIIHEYSYKPKSWQFKNTTKDNGSHLFLGIELEIESNYPNKDINALPKRHIYAKYDGSVRGFEAVSHPMTFNWLKEHYHECWEKVLNLRFNKCKSYNSENQCCGMHIHLSQKAFTPLHLLKFMGLFYHNPKFIFCISQRKQSNLCRWASLQNDNNIIYKAKYKRGTERYTAVNMCNHSTVEIRIFRGTLNPNSFWKNIEFCKAVYDYTLNESHSNITVNGFCIFVDENQKEYPHLCDFLKKRNYINNDLYAWRWNKTKCV